MMRLGFTHVVRHVTCHEIVQRELQDKGMFRLHKLRMNRKYLMTMLKFQRKEKPY